MDRGRQVMLWGGPEDGATVWVPPGDLPQLVGTHRTADGALVPIRGRQLNLELAHVDVYEHATVELLRAYLTLMGARPTVLPEHVEDSPLYVHRDLAVRWLSRGCM